MPTARGDVACAVLNPSRSLVVVGGHDGNAHVGKVEILDVDDNSWSGAADMTVPRGDPAAVALSGDRVLVVGGEITVDHDRDESTDMRTEVAVHVGEVRGLG